MERYNAEADYNNENFKTPACPIMMDDADYGYGSGLGMVWLQLLLGLDDI